MRTPPELPTIADVEAAAKRLAGAARHTPLLEDPALGERIGGRVLVKCENLQHTGSFKFRGAFNALAQIAPDRRAAGVLAISSGNHGSAVAAAGRHFGVSVTVVMPADAPAAKRDRVERTGARIVPYDRATDDREAIAAELCARTGLSLIHPYDDPHVIAGQGTIGLEIAADAERLGVDIDQLVIPCGGGGLSAGIGLAIRARLPNAGLWAVEPDGFDDYRRSLAAGHAVANDRASGSVADALMAPSPGPLGFALNRRNLSRAVTAADDAMLRGMAHAATELKLVLEPAGAIALAALAEGIIDGRGKTSVAVLSGGNVDGAMLARALKLEPVRKTAR